MPKRIGILGGMSPESTSEYYEYITHTYTERFGDYGYPEIIIYSVSFQPYVDWPNEDRWDLVAQGLSKAAQSLEAAGADFIIIATNTMHLVFDQVQASVSIPMHRYSYESLELFQESILRRAEQIEVERALKAEQARTPSTTARNLRMSLTSLSSSSFGPPSPSTG